MKKIKVLITGATGMVGEGVMHECLNRPEVEQVGVVVRKSCGVVHEKLVEIIENYFEMPLKFRGVDIRKDLNDGKNIETRVWHIDAEDSRIIKILFYLENVDEHAGPFSYIEKDVLDKNNKLKKNHDGRINQEEILLHIEKEKLKKFCSSTNNFAIVDTGNIYHKGELPINKNRYAIFFLL